MKKTETRGRKKLAKSIQFIAGRQEMEAIDVIEAFYQLTNHQACLRLFIALTVLDIANLPRDEGWSPEKKAAHTYCREQGKVADEAVAHLSYKRLIKELKIQNPNGKYTVRELQLMNRGMLTELAEGKGVSCVGKRRSGIIKAIKEKQDDNT